MSRKSRQRAANRKLRPTVPFWVGIAFLVAGLIAGSVLTFGVQYWNSPITRDEAISVTGTLESAKPTYKRHRGSTRVHLSDIMLYFTDLEGYMSISRALTTQALADELTALPPGTAVDMLVHPHDDNRVLSLTAGGTEYVHFDQALQALRREANTSLVLGLCFYALAAYGTWSAVVRWRYRRVDDDPWSVFPTT